MLRIRRALQLAKQAAAEKVEVPVEDLERILIQNMDMDVKLAKCMSKLSKADFKEIFGEMFVENT